MKKSIWSSFLCFVTVVFVFTINCCATTDSKQSSTSSVKDAIIGVYLIEKDGFIRGVTQLPNGPIVASVFINGPADNAGITPGDIITSVDGKKIVSRDDCVKMISKRTPPDEVKLKVYRNGDYIDFLITTTRRDDPLLASSNFWPGICILPGKNLGPRYVSYVFADTPESAIGLSVNDQIRSYNGSSIGSFDVDNLLDFIRKLSDKNDYHYFEVVKSGMTMFSTYSYIVKTPKYKFGDNPKDIHQNSYDEMMAAHEISDVINYLLLYNPSLASVSAKIVDILKWDSNVREFEILAGGEIPSVDNPYGFSKNVLYYQDIFSVDQWMDGGFFAELALVKNYIGQQYNNIYYGDSKIYIRNAYNVKNIKKEVHNAFLRYRGAESFITVAGARKEMPVFDLLYYF